MRMIVWAAAFAAVAAVAAAAVAQGKPWKCTATGMVSGSYDGGATAYIHLEGFSKGGNYSVTKKGNVATGVTANGTKFTCRQS